MPSLPGVSTSSALSAFNKLRLSTLMVSGMVRISLYPFEAATNANPIPVLPEVGSIITVSLSSFPFFSASSTIARAILSFTELSGLKYSNLAINLASSFRSAEKSVSCKSGVFPISSVSFLAYFAITLFLLIYLYLLYHQLKKSVSIFQYTMSRRNESITNSFKSLLGRIACPESRHRRAVTQCVY